MTNTAAWPYVPKGYVYRSMFGPEMAILRQEVMSSRGTHRGHYIFLPSSPISYPSWLALQTDKLDDALREEYLYRIAHGMS